MLNLYAVTVWHSSEPQQFETVEVRTYSARRAEHLASESFPGCRTIAEPIYDLMERPVDGALFSICKSTLSSEAAASPQTGDIQDGVLGGQILPLPPGLHRILFPTALVNLGAEVLPLHSRCTVGFFARASSRSIFLPRSKM